MSDYECTLLAGIPNAPSVYAPTANPDLAASASGTSSRRWWENGYLTQEQADAIVPDAE